MKSTSRTVIIIAAALVGVGVILAFLGYALSGFHINNIQSNSTFEHNSYTYDAAGVTSIDISDIDSPVILQSSSAESIAIDCYENSNYRYEIKQNMNGTLSVQKINSTKWGFQNCFHYDFTEKPLTVTIPSELIAEVSVSDVSGEISIRDIQTLSLSASNTSGSILIENTDVRGDLRASSVSGTVSFDSASISGNLSSTTTSGAIQTRAVSVGADTEFSSVSGNIRLNDTDISEDITLGTTSGSIDFEMLSGNNLNFHTVSGRISGTLHANSLDYNIVSNSLSGKVSVMGGSAKGTKRLEVSSTSGDINITFE